MLRITDELLEDGRTLRRSWTRAQLELLGVQWPPESGWRARIIGNPITSEDARAFIELANVTVKPRPVRYPRPRVNVDLEYTGPKITAEQGRMLEERARRIVTKATGTNTFTCTATSCNYPFCTCG